MLVHTELKEPQQLPILLTFKIHTVSQVPMNTELIFSKLVIPYCCRALAG